MKKAHVVIICLQMLAIKVIAQQNVGIGTNAPTELLHVNGGNIRLSATVGTPSPRLVVNALGQLLNNQVSHDIGITFTRANTWVGSIRHVQPASPNASTPPVIRFSNSAENADDMVIDDQGRVGIGRRNPTNRLHVEGTFRSEGTISTGGGLGVAGNAIIAGDLSIGGALTFANLSITGNGSFGGTLSAVGLISTNNNIRLSGNTPTIAFRTSAGTDRAFMQVANNDFMLGTSSGNSTGSLIFRINNTNHMFLNSVGNLSLGTNQVATGYKLNVAGKIICEELRVRLQSAWPDYVFGEQYKLMPLDELGAFINKNKHLPNIPAAIQMEEAGLAVGEMQRRMMEKIEELTLYILELKEENDKLKVIFNTNNQ
jgi:hypothetical protein